MKNMLRAASKARAARRDPDMLRQLQMMIYDFHALGCFEEARPHLLWLMEIVENAQRNNADVSRRA